MQNHLSAATQALRAAENFIAGFEGDEMQERVSCLLTEIRKAQTGLEYNQLAQTTVQSPVVKADMGCEPGSSVVADISTHPVHLLGQASGECIKAAESSVGARGAKSSEQLMSFLDGLGVDEQDWENLIRLQSAIEDGQGYDVPKSGLRRLGHIGLTRWVGGSNFELTKLGLAALAARREVV